MTHNIETQWMGKMQFNALVNGHTVVMDAPERVGGEDLGPIPKPFVLSALSGCTGMDVIGILRKINQLPQNFSIDVAGEISKQPPIEYVSIHVVYSFEGDDGLKQAALQAVMDSQEKFCGISHMLKKILPLTWEVNYNHETIFSNKKPAMALA